ncbi:hypothetical protein SAMN05192553_11126 [Cyclobacterium xiamenense]|uniref:Uncharacterized protein n=1 Tax=Cyclobacterium xiamenense TaxID=1297121 RepID=A0A1H7BBF3_9BACT|nr:hypothetical protein SAMN05192553_11126 [Cyclobacterium xiamenense]
MYRSSLAEILSQSSLLSLRSLATFRGFFLFDFQVANDSHAFHGILKLFILPYYLKTNRPGAQNTMP